MNPSDPNHRELLDELINEGNIAPTTDDVLRLLRREQAVKRRRQTVASIVGVLFLAGVLLLPNLRPTANQAMPVGRNELPAPPNLAPATRPPALAVERINDEQLLEMLSDHPVALVQLADGGRRLLVMGNGQPVSRN